MGHGTNKVEKQWFNSFIRRIRRYVNIYGIGIIFTVIRNTIRELNHLLKVILDRELEGTLTFTYILRTRRKLLAVLNIEITKNYNFRERRKSENALYFGVLVVEEFRIVSRSGR